MKIIKTILILMIAMQTPLWCQLGNFGIIDGKHGGMAGVSNSNATGLYAIQHNPALIHKADSGSFLHLMIPSFGMQYATNTLSFDDINKYFGNDESSRYVLTDADKKYISDEFDELGQVLFNANLTYFAIGWKISEELGAITFSANESFTMGVAVPDDAVNLLLNGNETNVEYDFNDLDINQWWVQTVSVGYSKDILNFDEGLLKNLSAGLSLNLYSGRLLSYIEMQNSSLYTREDDHRINGSFTAKGYSAYSEGFRSLNFFGDDDESDEISGLPETAGMGIGFNVGLSAELSNGIVLGIAMTDIGSLSWDNNAEEHDIRGNFVLNDITNENELDSLKDGINTDTKSVSEIDGCLPQTLRLGATMPVHKFVPIPGMLYASVDMNIAFNKVGMNNDDLPYFGLGLWYQPFDKFPILTTGIRNDRMGSMRWSMGIGYETKYFDIYLSSYDIISTFSPEKHWSAAMTMQWKMF